MQVNLSKERKLKTKGKKKEIRIVIILSFQKKKYRNLSKKPQTLIRNSFLLKKVLKWKRVL